MLGLPQILLLTNWCLNFLAQDQKVTRKLYFICEQCSTNHNHCHDTVCKQFAVKLVVVLAFAYYINNVDSATTEFD